MPEQPKFNKVLIYSFAGLGNAILFTPILEALARHSKEIYFLAVRQAVADYFSECPHVKVELVDCPSFGGMGHRLKVLWSALRMRSWDFDLMLPVFPSNRIEYNLFASIVSAKERFGFCYPFNRMKTLGWLQGDQVLVDSELHDVEHNKRLLHEIGVDSTDCRLKIWNSTEHEMKADAVLQHELGAGSELVGYHTECFPDMQYKRWPAGHFAELISAIDRQYDCRQMLIGTPSEVPRLQRIKEQSGVESVAIVSEHLLTVAEVIRKCSLFISNDSGLMHLAAAVDTPVIGLFGPSLASRTAPWSKASHVILSTDGRLPCRRYPFAKDNYPDCCGGKECMRQITPEQVLHYIKHHGLLGTNSS
ncbi:MAG: glycosyltransferase family 9 protein [Bdellovibrionales bacterium]|nr:glycosyltransferase family 9 protein [Bdellovibrionales bacterium]